MTGSPCNRRARRLGSRAPVLLFVGLLACSLLADPQLSGADSYVDGARLNKPDNFEHTFCWGGLFANSVLRPAAEYAMANLDSQTAYYDNFVNPCNSTTDVQWYEDKNLADRGLWACFGRNGIGECETAQLILNPNYLGDTTNRQKTTCHELGHSVGLIHGGSDCMIEGPISSGYQNYDGHHIGHMDRSHGSPLGFLDSAIRVSGGIRVTGWTLDPDLKTDKIAVHIYVDVTGFNIGNAQIYRSTIANLYPYWGGYHDFDATVSTGSGPNRVCAYGINVYEGANTTLGCINV